jgi:hypothetical protein
MKIADLYQSVTADIIKDLEAGSAPWTKPWRNGNESSCRDRVCHVCANWRFATCLLSRTDSRWRTMGTDHAFEHLALESQRRYRAGSLDLNRSLIAEFSFVDVFLADADGRTAFY